MSSWVTNIGEEFLTVHTNLGTSSVVAKEFCEDHGQLMDELKVVKEALYFSSKKLPPLIFVIIMSRCLIYHISCREFLLP